MSSNMVRGHQKGLVNNLFALVDEDQRQQLFKWNNTFSEYDTDLNIVKVFEKTVGANPLEVALTYDGKILTFRELNDQINQLAYYLNTAIDLHSPSKIIALALEPSFELLIAILAILKIGYAYLPLDVSHPRERINLMLNDAKVSAVITVSTHLTFFQNQKYIICLDKEKSKIDTMPIQNIGIKINKNDLAYIIYTSGSTGIPKGVMLTHANVNNFFHWFENAIAFNRNDVFDFSSPITFDFTVPMTLFPMAKGFQVVICSERIKKDPLSYLNHLIKNKVTIIKLTPSYFRELKEFVEEDLLLSNLRWIIFGGEKLYKSDINKWLQLFPHQQIFNEYGPTEATVAITGLVINQNNIDKFQEALPIGRAVLNTQLYILNDKLQFMPIGQVGEIFIGGESVAVGYLNNQRMTSKKFIMNPFSLHPKDRLYRTGDLGKFLPDGAIEFIGRVDDQIKIRGFRVEIEEINKCLRNHPDLKSVASILKENEVTHEKQIVTYCISKTKPGPSIHDLRQFILMHLPEYMVPTQFCFIDQFPLNQNGKLDLKKLALMKCSTLSSKSLPTSNLEKTLADIWCNTLAIEYVSANDNFFELGGNSLSAARIVHEIRKVTKKDLLVEDIYEAPTIAQLIDRLKTKGSIETIPNKLNVDASTDWNTKIPLSDMQLLFWIMEHLSSKLKVPNIVKRCRLKGKIEKDRLAQSFHKVFNRHEILNYASSLYPIQYPQEALSFEIIEQNLSEFPKQRQVEMLHESFNQLQNHLQWNKGQYLLLARLFYLNANTCELQIAVPHLMGDDISLQLILQELSHFYINEDASLPNATQYKQYIRLEKNNLTTIERDIQFWETYLSDASHLHFSENNMLANETNVIGRTTFFPLKQTKLDRLFNLSKNLNLSITDILCALLSVSLMNYLANPCSKHILINLVKSTRDHSQFDHTIGLFIRNDLIKVPLTHKDLIDIATAIKESHMTTASYQFCPGIIKLASSFKRDWQKKKVLNSCIKWISLLIAKLFPSSLLHPQVLNSYGKIFIAQNKDFIVNLNILNTFFNPRLSHEKLFGLEPMQMESFFNERIAAQNVLDVCFERDDASNPYLVISSNLKPELREQIGQQFISHLENFLIRNHSERTKY